jgi:glycosyltransferase involved in cell wall biosynthesis
VDISAVLITYNEQHALLDRIPELGLKDTIILDNGSTDRTVEIANMFGARVFDTSNMFMVSPSSNQIGQFTKKYGFRPTFTTKDKFQNMGERREWGASLAENDWCYFPDCDEQTTWDLGAVTEILPSCDRLSYRFIHSHNEDGSSSLEFTNTKLFNRNKSHWQGYAHEVGVPDSGAITLYTDKIKVDHWQKEKEYRNSALSYLEYQVLLEPSQRNTFYLGRQYMSLGHIEKAIRLLKDSTEVVPSWTRERAQAYMLLAECYKSKSLDATVSFYHSAIMDDGTRREPFWGLALAYIERKEYPLAAVYLEAATAIQYNPDGYNNSMWLYDGITLENKIIEVQHMRNALGI